MKILLVNYHYYPSKVVAAARISYWAKILSKKYDVDVFTNQSNAKSQSNETVHFVNHFLKGFPSSINFFWGCNILLMLIKNKKKYDVILMSGSPFLYFWIAPILHLFSRKVIIDYRDPYALNPLHPKGFVITKLRNMFEKTVNKFASSVITVNKVCGKLIYAKTPVIIDNGYDDTVFPTVEKRKIKTAEELSFFYGGKFSTNRDISPLIGQLESLGRLHLFSEQNHSHKLVINYGLVPYSDFIVSAETFDVAVLLVAGFDFESTTKLFDYMALKKPILVISSTGFLSTVMEDYLGHYPYTLYDNENNLVDKIHCLVETHNDFDYNSFEVDRFSRLNSIKLLEKLIES